MANAIEHHDRLIEEALFKPSTLEGTFVFPLKG